MKPIRIILVPVDFSANSEQALWYAVHLAKLLGAEVHLLHSYMATLGMVTPYGEVLPADFAVDIRAAAVDKLDDLRKKVAERDLQVQVHLREAAPSVAICDVASEIEADLIVMGTRGLSGLRHVLLGSVAERTVRNAPCPVLTMKADVDKSETAAA